MTTVDLGRFEPDFDALVVGSGGIGAALAEALAAHPRCARVFRTARRPDAARARAQTLALDLCDDESIARFGEALADADVHPALVIVTAGVLHDSDRDLAPEKRLADLDRSNLQHSFDVNAVGPLLLARALASRLPRREHAVWATLSARVGSIGDNRAGGWYAYRMSKAAQNMATRTLAIELGRRHRGLAVVALHPGTVSTPLSAPYRAAEDPGVRAPEVAAGDLLSVIDGLDASHSGRFFAWDGSEIPW